MLRSRGATRPLGAGIQSEPRRRSWPHEPTRLEILATRMGIDDEALRALLQGEIQRRLRERGEAWRNSIGAPGASRRHKRLYGEGAVAAVPMLYLIGTNQVTMR